MKVKTKDFIIVQNDISLKTCISSAYQRKNMEVKKKKKFTMLQNRICLKTLCY